MNRVPLVVAAWIVVAGASTLPRVVLQELLHVEVSDDARTVLSASVIAIGLLVAAVGTRFRPLVPFLVVFLGLVGAEWLVFRVIDQAPAYRAWLADPSFNTYMLAEQSLRLMVTGLVIAVLLVIRGRPSRFFLEVGDVHAPMRPVVWLGVRTGTTWSRFGPVAAVVLSGGSGGAAQIPIRRRPAVTRPSRASRSSGASKTISSETSPSTMNTTRSARAATWVSWVTSSSVIPSAWNSASRSMISEAARVLRAPVGSSPNTIRGRRINARQIPARCS